MRYLFILLLVLNSFQFATAAEAWNWIAINNVNWDMDNPEEDYIGEEVLFVEASDISLKGEKRESFLEIKIRPGSIIEPELEGKSILIRDGKRFGPLRYNSRDNSRLKLLEDLLLSKGVDIVLVIDNASEDVSITADEKHILVASLDAVYLSNDSRTFYPYLEVLEKAKHEKKEAQ